MWTSARPSPRAGLPARAYGRPPLAPAAQRTVEQEYAVVTSADDVRRAVRQAFYHGAN